MNNFLQGRRNRRPGFTLLELAFVLGIIGLGLVMLNSISFKPSSKVVQREFENQLNSLFSHAYVSVLSSSALHRVVFELEKKEVVVEKETDKVDAEGNLIFENVAQPGMRISLPKTIEIKNLYINGVDELAKTVQVKTTSAWMYITSDGIAQELIINMQEVDREPPVQFSFVLNPFTVQVRRYDTFSKP